MNSKSCCCCCCLCCGKRQKSADDHPELRLDELNSDPEDQMKRDEAMMNELQRKESEER